jgi:hypothetical protein
MKPMAAAVGAALISGVAMYTVGAKTAEVDAFAQTPAPVYTQDAQYVPAGYPNSLQPVAAPVRQVAPPRPVRDRAGAVQAARTAPAQARVGVEEREAEPKRSWTKTAMIIGGSAASGAAVGGIVDGKKGALIGAAIGGGAASIYEATRRR